MFLQKTVSITETKGLLLSTEIMDLYCEKHMKHMIDCLDKIQFLKVKEGGVYSYRFALKSWKTTAAAVGLCGIDR